MVLEAQVGAIINFRPRLGCNHQKKNKILKDLLRKGYRTQWKKIEVGSVETNQQTRHVQICQTLFQHLTCSILLFWGLIFSSCWSLSRVVLCQEVCKLLVRSLGEHGVLPHVRGQVRVRLTDGFKGGLGLKLNTQCQWLALGIDWTIWLHDAVLVKTSCQPLLKSLPIPVAQW